MSVSLFGADIFLIGTYGIYSSKKFYLIQNPELVEQIASRESCEILQQNHLTDQLDHKYALCCHEHFQIYVDRFSSYMSWACLNIQQNRCQQWTVTDNNPDSKVHGANMGPTWVLSAPGVPLGGPINLAVMDVLCCTPIGGILGMANSWECWMVHFLTSISASRLAAHTDYHDYFQVQFFLWIISHTYIYICVYEMYAVVFHSQFFNHNSRLMDMSGFSNPNCDKVACDTTAMMLWHVQKCCGLITRNWVTAKWRVKFPSNLNYEYKIISELGPWTDSSVSHLLWARQCRLFKKNDKPRFAMGLQLA